MHIRAIAFALLVLGQMLGVSARAEQDDDAKRLVGETLAMDVRVTLGLGPDTPRRLRAGAFVRLALTATVKAAPPGSELHLLFLPADAGGALIALRPPLREGAQESRPSPVIHLSVGDSRIDGPATLTDTATGRTVLQFYRLETEGLGAAASVRSATEGASILVFDASQHLTHVRLPTSALGRAAGRGGPDAAQSRSGGPDMEIAMTLVRMGAVERAGDGAPAELSREIGFLLPQLPLAFDGLLVLPVVSRSVGAGVALRVDTVDAPPLLLPVEGSEGAAPFSARREKTARLSDGAIFDGPRPHLRLTAEQAPIPVGRAVRRRFEVRHESVPEGAEIYVALLPANVSEGVILGRLHGRYLRGVYQGLALDLSACDIALRSDFMRIRQSPVSVAMSVKARFPDFDAGRLGVADAAEGGRTEGVLDFVAPPLPHFYTDIVAVPAILRWDKERGRQCLDISLRQDDLVAIPLLGR